MGHLSQILAEKFESKKSLLPILETSKDLLKDQSYHVRNSLIRVFASNLQNFPENFTESEITPILMDMIKDSVVEVKLQTIRNLQHFLRGISLETFKEKFFPELVSLSKETNWKIRHVIIQQASNLMKAYGEVLLNDIMDLVISFRDDHVDCIRRTIIEDAIKVYNLDTASTVKRYIKELLEYWSSSGNYIFRNSSLQFLESLCGVVDGETLREFGNPIIEKTMKDKVKKKFIEVVNVRISLLRVLIVIKEKDGTIFGGSILKKVVGELKEDLDSDVIYFRGKLESIIRN